MTMSVLDEIGATFRVIHEIANHKEKKDRTQLALKTCEECGELAQAVLSFTEAPGCAYKEKTRDDIFEEAADTIICALATAFKETHEPLAMHGILLFLNKKIQKWEDKIAEEAARKPE